MALALIGMSGVGKSHWSKLLTQECGFRCYAIDEMIELRLQDELMPKGFSGIHGLSRWLGQPYEEHFEERQVRYLLLERGCMQEIITQIDKLPRAERGKVVLDATGSVIHTGKDVRDSLRECCTIAHLETPGAELDRMLKLYLAEPKPVIWGHLFMPRPDEERSAALKRCYAQLLAMRERLYRSWATRTVSWDAYREGCLRPTQFLSLCGYAVS